jgi:hypothetical protein
MPMNDSNEDRESYDSADRSWTSHNVGWLLFLGDVAVQGIVNREEHIAFIYDPDVIVSIATLRAVRIACMGV